MILAAVALLLAAVVVFWLSSRQKKATGLPEGRVIYSDTGRWGKVEKPLYDAETGLTGRPDYLVAQEDAAILLPVEVKSTRAPASPYDSHVFQLAAYCLLVEKTYKTRPPYGILKYRDRTFAIDYTPALTLELSHLLDEIRQDQQRVGRKSSKAHAGGLDRSHEEPARCARCGYRRICDQRL